MEKTVLDIFTEQSLDCREDFKKVIICLSALHRRIGRLEGKIEVLSDYLRDQRDYCHGVDLIHISQLEGMLSEVYAQMEGLGISNDKSNNIDDKTRDLSVKKETITNSNIIEEE